MPRPLSGSLALKSILGYNSEQVLLRAESLGCLPNKVMESFEEPMAYCIPLLACILVMYPSFHEEAKLFLFHLLGLYPCRRAFPIDQGRDNLSSMGNEGHGCSGSLYRAARGSTSQA